MQPVIRSRRRIAALQTALWGVAAVLVLPAAARADTLGDLEAPFRAALESGSFGMALGLVFLGGVATSFTPCVYPMIAITVSVFGARQTETRLQGALLSSAFVLGIAALFTPLGLVAAMTGGVFGAALSSPIVLVGLALLFLALAASMFGAFDLDLPSGLKNRLAMVGGVGVKGAFVLGLCSALIAAPCTGPVLGFLLTWVGTTGNVAFGALSLFVYALGLGLLFWLVGTFSVTLPKSGQWLEWIKSVFGIVMVVAAIYYVRDLIPGVPGLIERTDAYLFAALGLVFAGLALGAIHLSFHDAAPLRKARKGTGVVLAVLGLCGLLGYAEALKPGAKLAWADDFAQASALARAQSKPLLVDFGASWCGACGELDRLTFSDPRVVREGQRFVAVKIDLSPGKDTPDKQAVLGRYSARGLPLVVLHDSAGKEVTRVTRFVPAEEMLALMQQAR